ncbi:GL24836 [Drosophila persimilis]|uniref:GL24836 n=1 Tax=Drosophila persimilis TaxID=7234 RepID=B4GRZ7_DROPE|nr:M-phase-specific PLK1-interacting protein [Drosophila persimilis]EDW40532.1 GL24836 [Drosophila persimilis]
MGTPRRGFNNLPPYSQGMRQYPSQGSEYMSQHAGGLQAPQQPNFGFYEDKQSFAQPKPNTPHFYQNTAPQEQMHRPRQQQQMPFGQGRGRNFGRGGGGFNRRPHHHFKDHGSQYFHPSMLEDPWRDLMARHNAIHGPSVDEEQVGV